LATFGNGQQAISIRTPPSSRVPTKSIQRPGSAITKSCAAGAGSRDRVWFTTHIETSISLIAGTFGLDFARALC